MIDHYKVITVTHKSLNTQDLEHFIIRHDDEGHLTERLNEIKKRFGQEEIQYLSTCNRVIYFLFGAAPINSSSINGFFEFINPNIKSSGVNNLDKIVEIYEGVAAISHLFEVAASIDSLVIGEREIFRQFRTSYRSSVTHDLSGDNLRIAERSIVQAAKDVYTNTAIGAKPVSVVSLAIQQFLKFQLPKDSKILLIGAGETNSTVGRFLKKHEYQNIVIFNRTLDNAQKLSAELGAQALHLSALQEYIEGYDAIFTCTAAQDPIITTEVFSKITKDSSHKVIIDLSIPNNVSREVAESDQVQYISVDSIRLLAEENLKFRSGNVVAARKILKTHLEGFSNTYQQRTVERALGDLPEEIKKVKHRALDLVYKEQIEALPSEAQDLINEIAAYMEKKCIAVPMKLAKGSVIQQKK